MYDLIIVGGGPAGLSASIYASRYTLKTLLISKQMGGQVNDAHKIYNYPGLPGIGGFDLAGKFMEHAKSLGVEMIESEVVSTKTGNNFAVQTSDNKTFEARALVLALGKSRKKLNVEGEDSFLGRGVSYCATCDGPLFKDKTVIVVGGSDAATTAALLISDYAKMVYLVYRGESLKGMPVWTKKIRETRNIKVIYKTEVTRIEGKEFVESVLIKGPGGEKKMKVDGVFVEIGGVPQVSLAKALGVKVDGSDRIVVGQDQSTSVKGVFAAGDATAGSDGFKQVVTAAAEGAVAARSAYAFIKGGEKF